MPRNNSVDLQPGRRVWGGFYCDKLDMIEVDTGWGGFGTGGMAIMPALFKTKRGASARYEDVRPVILRST